MLVAKNTDVQSLTMTTVEGLPIVGNVTLKPMMAGKEMVMLEIRYPRGSGSPTHAHAHESVCYVIEGRIKAVVEGAEHTLAVGDACVHPKDVPHSVEALEDSTILEIKSPPMPLEQFLGTA